jgi:hypothetical protein
MRCAYLSMCVVRTTYSPEVCAYLDSHARIAVSSCNTTTCVISVVIMSRPELRLLTAKCAERTVITHPPDPRQTHPGRVGEGGASPRANDQDSQEL